MAQKADKDEPDIAWTWIHDQVLLFGADSKEQPPEGVVHRFWVLSKYQFRHTVGKAIWCTLLRCLVLWEDKLMAVQMDIGWV